MTHVALCWTFDRLLQHLRTPASIAWIEGEDDEQLAALPAPEPSVPDVEVPDAAAAIEKAAIADLDHDGVPDWPAELDCVRLTIEDEKVFGRKAPLYYLGAWLASSDMPEAEHKSYKPTVASMKSYIAAKGR